MHLEEVIFGLRTRGASHNKLAFKQCMEQENYGAHVKI